MREIFFIVFLSLCCLLQHLFPRAEFLFLRKWTEFRSTSLVTRRSLRNIALAIPQKSEEYCCKPSWKNRQKLITCNICQCYTRTVEGICFSLILKGNAVWLWSHSKLEFTKLPAVAGKLLKFWKWVFILLK